MRKADCTAAEWAEYLRKTRERLRAWRTANRDKFNADRRAARKKSPAKRRKHEREYRQRNLVRLAAASRFRRTGMTDEMFRNLIQLQNDKCAVCELPFGDGRRCADHDHDTKEPRGVLCIHCNAIEGHAKKVGFAPGELGKRLDEYLANPPARR